MSTASLPKPHRVVVVGAGIGGLVSALLLASRGLDVTVIEKEATPGGKIRQVDGVDSGPTVFTMKWILEQIFEAAGSSLEQHLSLYPLDVIARHSWTPDVNDQYGKTGTVQSVDLFADREKSVDAIGRFSGSAQAKQFVQFTEQAARIYQTLEAPYIRSERPSFLGLTRDLGVSGLANLASLGPFASLWKALGRYFPDPRLRQLFGRYATYCGASPWLAPATLMLIADVEMQGVWGVKGGMYAVATALRDLAQSKGVKFVFNAQASNIIERAGRVHGLEFQRVRNDSSPVEFVAADSIVFNGDVAALSDGLLGEAAQRAVMGKRSRDERNAARSLSAITWSLNTVTKGFALDQHNVFFGQPYEDEFADVFDARRIPRRGTVYVCAQDRGQRSANIPNGTNERLLCLVNAPPDGDKNHSAFSQKAIEQCTRTHLTLLKECGLEISLQTALNPDSISTPVTFNRLFPATGGALYGQASHGWMNQFSRMGAVSRLPGFYLAGGSVHPGPGVPMAAMSGQLAAETILARLNLTSRSHRVVIAGGMSMRSATAASTG